MLLKAGFETNDRRLDRVPEFDELSRLHPVSQQLPPKAKMRSFTWRRAPQLDQGPDGACVGFGHTGRRGARPVPHPEVNDSFAFDIYHQAQEVDQWPGHDYEGTSVLAGAKVMKSLGYYSSYEWAFKIEDVLLGIGNHGPAVFGLPWTNEMFDPDPVTGLVSIGGGDAGSHCIYGNSVHLKKLPNGQLLTEPAVGLPNSWGSGWGLGGVCFILASNLESLLKRGGETCFPTEPNQRRQA